MAVLVTSYASLRSTEIGVGRPFRKLGDRSHVTREALERLVELYEAWGKEEKAGSRQRTT